MLFFHLVSACLRLEQPYGVKFSAKQIRILQDHAMITFVLSYFDAAITKEFFLNHIHLVTVRKEISALCVSMALLIVLL